MANPQIFWKAPLCHVYIKQIQACLKAREHPMQRLQ